eukprot:TRINITY_DN54617_c0_g1_i1.p1 TRINITY_DN54617_c0_g1~~TRINITY_DN54617_c0_g1_i1.p1  ORF type:complete len:424 (-),score=18.12 TRINITY_DN54617_c0_g1_i1:1252-2523(-)
MHVSQLPGEVQSLVLEYLHASSLRQAARTCCRWYELITTDPSATVDPAQGTMETLYRSNVLFRRYHPVCDVVRMCTQHLATYSHSPAQQNPTDAKKIPKFSPQLIRAVTEQFIQQRQSEIDHHATGKCTCSNSLTQCGGYNPDTAPKRPCTGAVLWVQSPVVVVGQIFGTWWDVLNIFLQCGNPLEDRTVRYLFLGSYVDRGDHGVPTALFLMALSILLGDRLQLLRGKHDNKSIGQVYGFFDEVKQGKWRLSNNPAEITRKSYQQVYRHFCDAFNYLPFAAVVDHHIFCTHGGLSPNLDLLQMTQLALPEDCESEMSAAVELLWAQPDPHLTTATWELNPRGCGWSYGKQAVTEFLNKHKLTHMLCGRHGKMSWTGFNSFFDHKAWYMFSPFHSHDKTTIVCVAVVKPRGGCERVVLQNLFT